MSRRKQPAGDGAPSPRREKNGTEKAGEGTRAPLPGEDAGDESPGLPGFRRWREVYLFVFVVFVGVVIALTIFSSVYA
jgi:hypothetical protein